MEEGYFWGLSLLYEKISLFVWLRSRRRHWWLCLNFLTKYHRAKPFLRKQKQCSFTCVTVQEAALEAENFWDFHSIGYFLFFTLVSSATLHLFLFIITQSNSNILFFSLVIFTFVLGTSMNNSLEVTSYQPQNVNLLLDS